VWGSKKRLQRRRDKVRLLELQHAADHAVEVYWTHLRTATFFGFGIEDELAHVESLRDAMYAAAREYEEELVKVAAKKKSRRKC